MMKFTKMQGLGNDYVYLNCTKGRMPQDISSLAKFISNRHFGIGSDGLILICDSDVADFRMRMFNQDGSEAQMCGNGIRCVGKYIYDKGLSKKDTLKIETLAGIKLLELSIDKNEVESVKVDMGEPILEPERIPVIAENKPVLNIPIDANNETFYATCVSMGNPHAVIFVDNVEKFEVEKYGKVLEVCSKFPEKSNIEFIQIVDRNNIIMRVWERGSGETMACGTGACAVAVASILNGKCDRKVNVQLLGGNLEINWDEKSNHVFMQGPAETVFEGELYL